MSSTYRMYPRIGVAGRIATYFETNPEEELTQADVCVKFNITQQTARSVISALQSQGLVVTQKVTVVRAPRQLASAIGGSNG